jgi:hypothetical protein
MHLQPFYFSDNRGGTVEKLDGAPTADKSGGYPLIFDHLSAGDNLTFIFSLLHLIHQASPERGTQHH